MAVSDAIIRTCLLYEFKLGTKAAEACRKICAALGEGTIAERTDQKWFKKLLSCHNLVPFSDRMLTCNEKWIMYCNKKRTYHWLASNNPVPMTPKPSIHQQKVLLCVWWTTAGIVHYELLPSGQTITAEIYSAQLDRVSVALHQKQAGLANRKGVVFHQDNARPHTAKITWETLARLQWEILPHAPYSPDLALSDYHLFLALDNHMRNRQF